MIKEKVYIDSQTTFKEAKKIYMDEVDAFNQAFEKITITDNSLSKKEWFNLYTKTCNMAEYINFGLNYCIAENYDDDFCEELDNKQFIINFNKLSEDLNHNLYYKDFFEFQTSDALVRANEIVKQAWDGLKSKGIKEIMHLIDEYQSNGYSAKLLFKSNSLYDLLSVFHIDYSLKDLSDDTDDESEYEELFENYCSDDVDENYKDQFVDEFIKYSAIGMVNDNSCHAVHSLNISLSISDINESKINLSLDELILKSKNNGELFIFDIPKKEFKFKGRRERDNCRTYVKALDCFWENVNKNNEAQRIFQR
jgi:hypothetical protein